MEIKDEVYHILKKIKENEQRIFLDVPERGKTVEYRLAYAPACMWAARVTHYLLTKSVPDSDIRPPESVGGMVATCGHRLKHVMWEVEYEDNEGTIYSVVCPDCYHRHYKGRKGMKSKRKRM